MPSSLVINHARSTDDEFGLGLSLKSRESEKTDSVKQFLAFSDSRQAAAFFASYFDQTYVNMIYKRLVVETVKRNHERLSTDGMSLPSFVHSLRNGSFAHPGFFDAAGRLFTDSGVREFQGFLEEQPKELKSYLKRFVPAGVAKTVGVEDFGWASELMSDTGRMSTHKSGTTRMP